MKNYLRPISDLTEKTTETIFGQLSLYELVILDFMNSKSRVIYYQNCLYYPTDQYIKELPISFNKKQILNMVDLGLVHDGELMYKVVYRAEYVTMHGECRVMRLTDFGQEFCESCP